MNAIKLALFCAICISMLTGCGCSTQENYDKTTQTEPPTATHQSDKNTMMDDAGNAVDDAGKIVEDAGDAVGDAARRAGNAMR